MKSPSSHLYACTDEIPMHFVRANQAGILLSIIITVITQQPWVLVIPLAVQLMSRWFGIPHNGFVRLIAPLFPASSKTESRELLRFNNLLAILFLIGSLTAFMLQVNVAAYVILAMLTAAVVSALSGFCVGCFMYFQWKQFRARRNF